VPPTLTVLDGGRTYNSHSYRLLPVAAGSYNKLRLVRRMELGGPGGALCRMQVRTAWIRASAN